MNIQGVLAAFGHPTIDHIGACGAFPTLSQLAGTWANALGWTHGEWARTEALQNRMSAASALVRPGTEIRDFQTVDLGQEHLRNPAWTTRGEPEHRAGGASARIGTHIRQRHYLSDAAVLTAVALSGGKKTKPTVHDAAEALERPARTLCIGRRPCLPSEPMLVGVLKGGKSLTAALQAVPEVFPDVWALIAEGAATGPYRAEWPENDGGPGKKARAETHRIMPLKDWRNRIHAGERVVRRGLLAVPAAAEAGR